MHKKYEITNQHRVEFLRLYNKLDYILNTLEEMSDLWLSDIQNLHSLKHLMAKALDFSYMRDEEGAIRPLENRVFTEDNVDKTHKKEKGAN